MAKSETIIDTKTQEKIDSWLNGEYDAVTKNQIKKLQQENPEELLNAFYQNMSFGTGGLRGIMGVGTNRMNPYTVRAATQGLANYILKQAPHRRERGVFIGFDCRHHSKEFAQEAAKVLAGNQIETYLYKHLRPVANISFGVRHQHCIAGIMITASHNPPQYNGYKVYWSYGGQVLPPHDQGIIDEVNKVTSPSLVKTAPFPHPLIHEVEEEIDKAYLDAIRKYQLHAVDDHARGHELKVVYTSLHGGGITMIPQTLREWGFTNLTIVEEQATPDGSFPTVKSPNPEDHAAMALGIEKLKAVDGDLLLGTDPDTDRLGVVVMHEGKPFFFDGNQVACLLLEHICRSLKHTMHMPQGPACIKTIVTTELFKTIAEYYGIKCFDVLTGFKYVGEKIDQWEQEKSGHLSSYKFLVAAEESYGYLVGTHVRDKDAIIAAASICDAASHMKLLNKTLVDLLYEIYMAYGVHREKLLSLTFEGREGAEKMDVIMNKLRVDPPKTIGMSKIELIEDYLNQTSLNMKSGQRIALSLPKSDVLRFWLGEKTKIVIRPSGTEPKIKIYAEVVEKRRQETLEAMQQAISSCDKRLDTILSAIKKKL